MCVIGLLHVFIQQYNSNALRQILMNLTAPDSYFYGLLNDETYTYGLNVVIYFCIVFSAICPVHNDLRLDYAVCNIAEIVIKL